VKRKFADTVRGNVLWLSLVSLLNDAASEMIYPLLPFFLVGTLGAGPAFLGVVEGIAESTSSFVKLASGWFSDRFRQRKPLVAVGYGVAAAVRPVIALATAPWHVLVIRFADRLGKGVRTAPRDALLAESVDAAVRGRAFGVHRAADHAGAFFGPLLASGLLLLLANDLRLVFALAAIPGALALLVVLLKVRDIAPLGAAAPTPTTKDPIAPRAGAVDDPETPPASTPRTASTQDPIAPRAGAVDDPDFPPESTPRKAPPVPRVSRDAGTTAFRRYLMVLALFTLGNATDAFLLLRAGDLGVPLAAIPLLWGAHHVAKSAFSVPGGALADRFGARATIVAGWLVYAATYVAFAFATATWQVWALFLVYGLFYGLTEAPEKALVAGLAADGRRGAAFGAFHFTIGITALPASVLFGLLWHAYGAPAAFLTGAALALAAALLLPLVVPRRAASAGAAA
jgi:MFS family permease